ncbi:hypothetical protein TcasGA2_TC034908 [Tribolium castaneum]|uniref:Uncharacterized protein n=1 Tax=Tribolium castaneum TaxID=7070 RepID=A0A139WAL4_TRICA|nr:hypothetical protein TcasGA2_TC034908 [Tribolium castaneum]
MVNSRTSVKCWNKNKFVQYGCDWQENAVIARKWDDFTQNQSGPWPGLVDWQALMLAYFSLQSLAAASTAPVSGNPPAPTLPYLTPVLKSNFFIH